MASSKNYLNSGPQFFDQSSLGFNLAWELDFWGRLRRAVAAADAQLQASVADYDQALVTLLGDVAENYVTIRTDQQRIRYLRQNVEIQELVLEWTSAGRKSASARCRSTCIRRKAFWRKPRPAFRSCKSTSARRRTDCAFCWECRSSICGTCSAKTAFRVPRPRWRSGCPPNCCDNARTCGAERLAAAQAELIGIAQAALYPTFSINGTLGWEAQNITQLFQAQSLAGNVGPTFQWNLLNYGRIVNNVRLQDAKFRELVVVYQQTVLQADQEVEDGLVTFLQRHRSHRTPRSQRQCRDCLGEGYFPADGPGTMPASISTDLRSSSKTRFNSRIYWRNRGAKLRKGSFQIYRALGGGWELRLQPVVPLPPLDMPPNVPEEGTEELQKLRNLLSPQNIPPSVPTNEPSDENVPPPPGEKLPPSPDGKPSGSSGEKPAEIIMPNGFPTT